MILSLPGGRSLAALPAFRPRSGWRGSDLDVAAFRSGCELDFCAAMKGRVKESRVGSQREAGPQRSPPPCGRAIAFGSHTLCAEFGQLVCLLLHLPLKSYGIQEFYRAFAAA